jgi:hypothetical protein
MGHSLVALWKHFSTIRDRNQEQPRSSIIIFFVLILVSEVSFPVPSFNGRRVALQEVLLVSSK